MHRRDSRADIVGIWRAGNKAGLGAIRIGQCVRLGLDEHLYGLDFL